MSDEFVENMEEYFGVRMDMDGLRIGNEHSGDSENKRTGTHLIIPLNTCDVLPSFAGLIHCRILLGANNPW
ncbi:Hypothetical predicted protein [Octopus vulgaris]|uniref:Uncharacterized protein n=1 Tax=Octopus vulgaris TaxID=6645 RepID=A0AA36FHS4_OCTVU|nr:Hypothetical predicted protein [Octopus vulgaris]